MRYCQKCGATLDDSARFCKICGIPVVPEIQAQSAQAYEYYQQNPYQNRQYVPYSDHANTQNMAYPPKPVDNPTIREILSKAFNFLKAKPITLWGITLLYSLLCILVSILGVLPILTIPINLVFGVGLVSVFLNAYRGEAVKPEQLFVGFKDFFHFCSGMAWMMLWIVIWALIPVAGIVFAVIKAYQYRFVPYILLNQPEISAADALRESIKQTEGYRGRMFGADIIMIGCIAGVLLIFVLLAYIPYLGIVFKFIYALVYLAVCVFGPLVFGVVQAVCYDEISKKILQINEKM